MKLGDIAQRLSARLEGDAEKTITSIAPLASARDDQLSFLANTKYLKLLTSTQAGAVLIRPDQIDQCTTDKIIVEDPYLAYAQVSAWFVSRPPILEGVHSTAVVSELAKLGKNVTIGPQVVIADGAHIGDDVVIGAGCFIGNDVAIGNGCCLHPNVTLYDGTLIGKRSILHAGAVLGSDGFGFANDNGMWVKIHQLGVVVVGDDVEIGANTTIDRGALGNTEICNGVKLDNQIQIAHNVYIGEHSAIAAGTGIAGSTRIGRYCTIAGCVGIIGHLEICDHVHVTAKSLVTKSITQAGAYSSSVAAVDKRLWNKTQAQWYRIGRLLNNKKSG